MYVYIFFIDCKDFTVNKEYVNQQTSNVDKQQPFSFQIVSK